MTTTAIRIASDNSLIQRSGAMSGNDGVGSVPGTVPTALTPLLSRWPAITATVATTRPISAPGMRALIFSDPATSASTPRPIASV